MSDALGDRAIRRALKSRVLVEQRHDDTVLVEELGLCRGRVRTDIAVVDGSLNGYEIKSDLDSLSRLHNQVDVYGKVLDYATLVVGDRLLDEAIGMIPKWWGVLHVCPTSHAFEFAAIRKARQNQTRDPRALVELLWIEQAVALLEKHDAARGIRGKPRRIVWDRICERVGIDEIAAAVRSGLKARVANQALASPSRCDESCQAAAKLPPSRIRRPHPQPS